MSKSPLTQTDSAPIWRMPLSPAEREALAQVTARRGIIFSRHPSAPILARLTRPLQDAYELKQIKTRSREVAFSLRWMYQQMAKLERSFWGWSQEEWASVVASVPRRTSSATGVQLSLHIVAYLYCGFLIVDASFSPYRLYSQTRRVCGAGPTDEATHHHTRGGPALASQLYRWSARRAETFFQGRPEKALSAS